MFVLCFCRGERKPPIEGEKNRSTESLPIKTPTDRLSVSDDMDKSQSQPNIAVIMNARKHSLDSSSPSDDSQSMMSEEIDPETGSMDKLEALPTRAERAESPEAEQQPPDADQNDDDDDDDASKSADDISADIDEALAEVMSGLESLEMQQKRDAKKAAAKKAAAASPSQNPKHTPDLVLDLPITSPSPGSSSPQEPRSDPDSPTAELSLSAAETFAKSNQSTIKKGASLPRAAASAGDLGGGDGCPKVKRSISTSGSGSSIKERQKRFSNSSDTTMQTHLEERARSASPSLITMPENLPSVRQTREILEATLTLTQPSLSPIPPPKPAKPGAKPGILKKPNLPSKSPQLLRKGTHKGGTN